MQDQPTDRVPTYFDKGDLKLRARSPFHTKMLALAEAEAMKASKRETSVLYREIFHDDMFQFTTVDGLFHMDLFFATIVDIREEASRHAMLNTLCVDELSKLPAITSVTVNSVKVNEDGRVAHTTLDSAPILERFEFSKIGFDEVIRLCNDITFERGSDKYTYFSHSERTNIRGCQNLLREESKVAMPPNELLYFKFALKRKPLSRAIGNIRRQEYLKA